MPSLPRIATAAAFAAFLLPAGAAHAATPGTVHATPAEAAQLLFVAGDVRRLERNPSGTVDTVLEQTLQQLYRDDPGLDPAAAEAEIRTLRGALAGAATSPATLTVMPGNQRVLAILAALERSMPSARAHRALTRVADRALTEASTSSLAPGRTFNPGADTVSTLLYGSFSPAATLRATAQLARGNARFGRARDGLWQAASHESVFDGARTLLARNPALQDGALRPIAQHLAGDGSLTVPIADLEQLARSGLDDIGQQTTDALAQHQDVTAACPGAACQDARDRTKADDPRSRAVIAGQDAALTAVGGLLGRSNAAYGAAIVAEAQAAAQVAGAVNSYFAATDYGEYIHIAADVVGLGASLAESVVNPAAAVTGVLTVVGDIVGVTVTGPDANALILQGLQGVSQQLSAFAAATSARFDGIDARLEDLTREVATLGSRLSAQIAEAREQITALGDALARLQGSVDRLQEEIRLLFAASANNDLNTLTGQSLRYEAVNDRPLGQEAFAAAAAALLTDALDTSYSEIVLRTPGAFDAAAAAGLGDLDPNINFFALFPTHRTDAPAGSQWPRALNVTCADRNGRLCLPSPDFWATSSRALGQLLLENRRYATPSRLTQIDAALMPGRAVAGALDRISDKDTDARTGSTLLNAASDYYASWLGRDADRPSGPPTLLQALRNERARALEDDPLRPDHIVADGQWVDPWGGASQPLGRVSLFDTDAFARLQSDDLKFTLPDVRPAESLLFRQPIEVLNAVRLGIGSLETNWDAHFDGDVPPNTRGTLSIQFRFPYYDGAYRGSLGTVTVRIPNASNCAGIGDVYDAERTVVRSWATVVPTGCPNVADAVLEAALHAPTPEQQTLIDDTVAHVRPLVEARLRELQTHTVSDLIGEDGGLTHGGGTQATDVAAAAQRLAGAQALLHGYVTLGFPQALATDDALRSLIAGDASNALADPYGAGSAKPVPEATLPRQIASFFRLALDEQPQTDPLNTLALWLNRHRVDLEQALTPYVKNGRAAGQDAADGGRLSQLSPLVASTIDRLELTRAVLADELTRPEPEPAPQPPAAPASEPAPQPAAPAPQAAPLAIVRRAAHGRLIHAPRLRGHRVRLTVGCVTGTCRFTVRAKAGRHTAARRFSLHAGARRTVSLRVRARRVRVKVTVAGTRRPLATRTLRRHR